MKGHVTCSAGEVAQETSVFHGGFQLPNRGQRFFPFSKIVETNPREAVERMLAGKVSIHNKSLLSLDT
jgi:hypothetical protein